MRRQVEIIKRSAPDAVIAVGTYAACAAFIRDARDGGLSIPIANLSFVGSESLVGQLVETGKKNGRDYTRNLINSQVVPSYEDITLPAVKQYRELMDRYRPVAPPELAEAGYRPLHYSFVSLEGFLNAKLLVAILRKMERMDDKKLIKPTIEGIHDLDIGIDALVSFGGDRHQGLGKVYYTTFSGGRFVPINWEALKK